MTICRKLALICATCAPACAGGEVDGNAPPGVVAVEVEPASVALVAGDAQQFTVLGRLSSGATQPVVATWSASGGTISPDGLFTADAPGSYQIIATFGTFGDTATALVTEQVTTADPTLLPAANGQRPGSGTYGRNLAAGQTYVDPVTGVTVLKLTSASVPASNSGMYHGYSEGGPNISQAWTGSDGQVYYTAKVGGWLVDVRYSTLTPTNWRRVSAGGETMFAFSLNPATPRIAYMITGGRRVERYNTATNQVENTGNWPWVISSGTGDYAGWLQTQVNDTWLTLMLNSNSTVVSFRPADGFQRVVTESGAGVSIDEPHLDREFPVVYLSTNSSVQNKIVNLETGAYTNPTNAGVINDDHNTPLRGKIAGISWQANAVVTVSYTGQTVVASSTSPTDWSGDYHMAGQWVFNNPSQYFAVDQWRDTGNYPIYKGMIGLVSGNDMRLLAAHDAQGTGYDTGGQPHPTLAPDGKFIMWTSNMNSSGRYDTFLARVPVR